MASNGIVVNQIKIMGKFEKLASIFIAKSGRMK